MQEADIQKMFEDMFRLPENYIEREIFVAAFGNTYTGDNARSRWESGGRKPEELPHEVIKFCHQELAAARKRERKLARPH